MTTILLTGGEVRDTISAAADLVDQGRKVIVFHEFPASSVARFPNGVEMVFKLDPEGADAEEIAEIYCADDIVDLDLAAFAAPAPQSAPQHLY